MSKPRRRHPRRWPPARPTWAVAWVGTAATGAPARRRTATRGRHRWASAWCGEAAVLGPYRQAGTSGEGEGERGREGGDGGGRGASAVPREGVGLGRGRGRNTEEKRGEGKRSIGKQRQQPSKANHRSGNERCKFFLLSWTV